MSCIKSKTSDSYTLGRFLQELAPNFHCSHGKWGGGVTEDISFYDLHLQNLVFLLLTFWKILFLSILSTPLGINSLEKLPFYFFIGGHLSKLKFSWSWKCTWSLLHSSKRCPGSLAQIFPRMHFPRGEEIHWSQLPVASPWSRSTVTAWCPLTWEARRCEAKGPMTFSFQLNTLLQMTLPSSDGSMKIPGRCSPSAPPNLTKQDCLWPQFHIAVFQVSFKINSASLEKRESTANELGSRVRHLYSCLCTALVTLACLPKQTDPCAKRAISTRCTERLWWVGGELPEISQVDTLPAEPLRRVLPGQAERKRILSHCWLVICVAGKLLGSKEPEIRNHLPNQAD